MPKNATYGLTALTPAYASALPRVTGLTAGRLTFTPDADVTLAAAIRALKAENARLAARKGYTYPAGLPLGAYAYAVSRGPRGTFTVTAPNGTRFTGLTASAVTAFFRSLPNA